METPESSLAPGDSQQIALKLDGVVHDQVPIPIPESQRIESLDVLRGLAVLCILVMNIRCFAMIVEAYENPTAYGDLSGANYLVWYLSEILFDGKFVTIFSMLFGAGILVFTRRVEAKGLSPLGLYYRRMAVLLVIGLLHAYLLWYGDILVAYAICGFVLYPFRKLRPRSQAALGCTAFVVPVFVVFFFHWMLPHLPAETRQGLINQWNPSPELVAQQVAAYRGGWLDQMSHRAPAAFGFQTVYFLLGGGFFCGGVMLIGMSLFRWGVYCVERSSRYYLAWIVAAAVVGVPVTIYGVRQHEAHGWNMEYSMFTGALYAYLAAPVISMGWIGLTMLACRYNLLGGVRTVLAAVGRMALSCYLLQSVLCTAIFYGHGFDLFGRIERTGQMAIVLLVTVVQLLLAGLWLRSYRFGPVEWLWRSLTYRQMQPLRRAAD